MEGVPPVRDSPLVGRRQQLRRLTALYHRAEQGQAGAVLLAGDAGVGKTRLVGELVHEPEPDPQRAAAAALVRRFAGDRPALARLAVDLTAGAG